MGIDEKATTLRLLGAIAAGPNSEVRFSLRRLRGRDLIDVRLFLRENYGNGFYPSSRGFSLEAAGWTDFVTGVLQADSVVKNVMEQTKDGNHEGSQQADRRAST